MEIQIIAEPEMIRAVASGNFTIETAKQTFLELVSAIKQHRAARVLFDARQVTGEISTMDRFSYGEFCAAEISKLTLSEGLVTRFAYVMFVPVLDPGRFGETVAVNRGMLVKATNSLDEAMEWLGLAENA